MFLVCGEALFDLFVNQAQSKLPRDIQFNAVAGGSPFNVAVGLSRLGTPSALLTGVSTCFLGQQLRQVLEAEGVSTNYLVPLDTATTTLSVVAVNEQGIPSYCFYGHTGADRHVSPEVLPALGPEVRGIHLGSYSLVVTPTSDSLYQLVCQADKNLLITLDPNVRLNVEPSLEVWRQKIDAFAKRAHIIKVSEEDLALLYPGSDLESIAQGLLSDQCRLVFLTQGERGVSLFTRNGHWSRPARPITPVDTVGAGDTFQAALITYLLEHGFDHPAALDEITPAHLQALLNFASEASALTCLRSGPDLPRRHELPQVAYAH